MKENSANIDPLIQSPLDVVVGVCYFRRLNNNNNNTKQPVRKLGYIIYNFI